MKNNSPEFFPEEAQAFARALDGLKNKPVAVLGHLRPDGDCIGSIVALVRVLRERGIEAVGVCNDATPANLASFIGDTPFMRAQSFEPEGHLAVAVDCSDFRRVGDRLNELFPVPALNVDHHISNELYASENIVVSNASATAEIIAGMLLDLGHSIDPVAAQALYVGIATDTGQFRFPSTTPKTFEITRLLCEHGARPAAAALELYERESFSRIKLLQAFLASLQLEFDNRVCVGFLEDDIFQQTGAGVDDGEGLVDYARSIDGVDIGIMIEEREGAIKASLRAKDPFYRVDRIAREFKGGGHACAAGLNIEPGTIREFYPELMSVLGKHLDALGVKETS
ncbi:MAG: DHH family phosphoesterase [Opitutales bacterium]